MVMLSELRHFHLVDGQQRCARLLDVAVALLDVDYPPVTQVLFQHDAEPRSLPWEAIQSLDWPARHLHVTDLAAGQAIASTSPLPLRGQRGSAASSGHFRFRPTPSLTGARSLPLRGQSAPSLTGALPQEAILLQRDILDALILDLQHRRVTRANDLWLEEHDQGWRLAAADTSARALVRRLSRGRYGRVQHSQLDDWKYVEFLRGDPQAARSGAGYHRRITRLPPGEIARLTDALPYLHAAELLILLPDALAAKTLEVMTPERQLQVFEELEEAQALCLLALMAPDTAADLVGRLDTPLAQHYLNRLPKRHSERIVDLLRYPEDTAGGIMTNDLVTVPAHCTVREARQALHERLQESDFVYFVYIVEDAQTQRLCGVITLRELLIANDECVLRQIMQRYLVTSQPLEPARTAAYRLIDSGLAALPVVGEDGQVLGALTVDAAVAQVAPARWRTQAPRVFT